MDLDFLKDIGLTSNEIKIYSALLSLGSVSSGRITFETNLHRSRVYEGLNRLIEKGLVNSVKRGAVTFFEATTTDKIIDVLEEEKKSLEEKIFKIKKKLPEIEKVRESKPKAEAIILQGVEGFKAMRRDIIKNSNGLLLMLGGVGKEDKVMPLFFDKWNEERKKKSINFRALFKQNVKKTRWVRDSLADEYRFLPSYIDNPAVINIYGDRVVNVLWKEDYPICFMVINKEMADAYSKYFDLLWKVSLKK